MFRRAGWEVLVVWECQTSPSKRDSPAPAVGRVPGRRAQAYSEAEIALTTEADVTQTKPDAWPACAEIATTGGQAERSMAR